MKNWKSYFSKTILKRGKDYYLNDAVTLLKNKNNKEFTFQVEGNSIYNVHIIKHPNDYDFECTCPFYHDFGDCKHIAASMYYLENNKLDKKEPIKYVSEENNPFIKNDNKFRYYDMSKIAKTLLFTQKDYNKALNIVNQNKYKDFSVKFGYVCEGCHFNIAECKICEENNTYSSEKAYIEFDTNSLKRHFCEDYFCSGTQRYYYYDYINDKNNLIKAKELVCYHQLVLLILLDKYFEENNHFDSTTYESKLFLQEIKKSISYEKNLPRLNDTQKLNMGIQIVIDNDFPKVNFKIGYEKTYIISNINLFINKMSTNDSMTFGINNTFLLSENNLTEKSKELYDILKRQNERLYSLFKQYYNRDYDAILITKDILLEGEFADEIFEYLTKNKETFIINNKYTKGKYNVAALISDYKLSTTIEDVSNKYEDECSISVKINMPIPILGLKYILFCDKNFNLCGCEKEKIGNLISLINNDKIKFSYETFPYSTKELIYGRNNISNFYNDIFPILNIYGEINDKTTDIIKNKITKKTEFLFRIDYKDYLICHIYKKVNGSNVPLALNNLSQEEEDVISCIKTYFPVYDATTNAYRSETTIETIYFILGVVVPYYMQIGEVEISENIKKIQQPKKTTFNIGVSIKSNLLNLNINSDDLSKDEIDEILSAYKKKVKYYKAKNEDIIDIQNSNLDIIDNLEDVTGISAKELLSKNVPLPLYRAIYLDELLKEKSDNDINRDDKFSKLIEDFENAKNITYELPKNINATLRPYQIQGYNWIKMLDATGFCGILADEMGLGKTLQTIAFLASIYENDEKNISIIITPASLIYNWKQEFEKFAPDVKVMAISGMFDERKEIINNIKNINVIITSYDLLKRDIELYENINFRCEIIDEAQYIKNQTTKASKSTKIINSKFRLALTGTPIENRLSELWSIFDFLMPNYLYNYNKFRTNFELPIVRDSNDEKLTIIKKMISPFILRRKKDEVLKDLPEKIDNNYYIQMNEKQSKLYKAEATKLKNIILKSDYEKDKLMILAQITRLRQICCDPSLIYDNYNDTSIKKEACISLIQEAIAGGHKMLIFSQFTSILDILANELTKNNINYYVITGKTSKSERVLLVDKFNNDATPVFLISLKAGGTGLNLIGADTVIHYDPWWNVSVQNQATDRAHRIGQTKIVNIYKLITKDTIEEKIIEMQEKKEKLSNDILSGELGGISKLSKDDLLGLINVN